MTRPLAVGLVVAIAICSSTLASADDGSIHGGTGDNSIWADSLERSQAARNDGQTKTAPKTTSQDNGPEIRLGTPACIGAEPLAAEGSAAKVTFCGTADAPTASQPTLTLGLIRSAFAELPLPAGTLVIQPPDGLTLVNFATNFYTTTTRATTRTVTLLHRRVTLQATPTSYHWHFGDGSATTTAEPGAPYPRLGVTHDYRRTGTYRPRLDTTYSGRYRVGGGPWRTIPGTVTIDGEPQSLRAIEAEPKLVPY